MADNSFVASGKKRGFRRLPCAAFIGEGYEGSCFREEDLQELQDRAPPPGHLRDLRGRAP
jgi:hypothetical protein